MVLEPQADQGKESVDAVLALENTYVLRVNPLTPADCAACRTTVVIGHEYDMTGKYGCSRSEGTVIV
ncbi:hypothetical protein AB0M92_36205 [Streptomyces sp. NPDC051582]|uniref:hypothetical protein n=1 Tax=Streptomyces sp. NPDC051582 TaxID=3155167 RepID=UPI00343BCFA8